MAVEAEHHIAEHHTTSRRRVLLIGLDAADGGLLARGAADGTLPALGRMAEVGTSGVVTSPPGFGSGAVWPSVATAVSPARHARYFYNQVSPGSYEAKRFDATDFRAAPVWEHLSDAGRSVAVYDVPKVGLSENLNGMIAVDWMAHGPVYKELRTWPPEYAAELATGYGTDPLPKCDLPGGRNTTQMREFLDTMKWRIGQRERLAADLLADGGIDLILTVFAEPHCVGHQTWHIRDERHPMHDAAARSALGDPLMDIYREIDASIGRLVERAGDDTVVIVFTGTGMGPNYTGNHVLDEALRRLDGTHMTVRRRLTRTAKLIAKRVLPTELRRRGRPMKRRVEESAAVGDRAQRRAYTVPHNDISGAVRLNLVGRDPNGKLQPDQVEPYIAELRTALSELRNVDTGEPVVDRVVVVRDEHHGEHVDRLPDLFVLWNRSSPIDRVRSDRLGTIEYVHRGNRTGDHNPDSYLFAAGPTVAESRLSNATVYDVMPTVSAILGVEPPETDGRVLDELVSAGRVRA